MSMVQDIKKMTDAKVLVISNNAFSQTKNNGKTLASLFEYFQPENIAQLYFNPELPDVDRFNKYYQITDLDMLRSLFSRRCRTGRQVQTNEGEKSRICVRRKFVVDMYNKIKNWSCSRLFREIIWALGSWDTPELNSWINEFSPDIIFFCAGDSGFAYDITAKLKNRLKTKFVVYITDDYVLPRRSIDVLWWIRRNRLLRKMRKAVNDSDLFITVSEKMATVYESFLGKESFVVSNLTDSLKTQTAKKQEDRVNFVYAGGLHSNRYKTIHQLAKNIKEFNEKQTTSDRKVFLSIYTNTEPSRAALKRINISGASEYRGSLKKDELIDVLNRSDILVFVESFDRRSIEATRLSLSTKIPEYLSLEKPVLAIGPSNVASMEYLSDVAFCVNDPRDIYASLEALVGDAQLRERIASAASKKYSQYHNTKKLKEEFKKRVQGLIDVC